MPIKAMGYDTMYEFSGLVAREEIEALVQDPAIRTLQTWQCDDRKILALLDAEFFSKRPDVTLRLFGFNKTCDLSVARELRHVKRFCANCLPSACHVEDIAAMPQLEELSLGVEDLTSFDFLEKLPATMRVLNLEATRSKKPDLYMLPRFQHLERLLLEGHVKGIEGIAALGKLQELTLRSISLQSLDFLEGLGSLQSLDVKLGCIRSFSVLKSLSGLRFLEIWRVKDLGDLDFLKELGTLQYLFLEALPHVESLPDMKGLLSLRRLRLEAMKNLRDFAAIAQAPRLEDFCILQPGLDPALLWPVLRMPSLRRVMGLLGSDKRNAELKVMLSQLGLESFHGDRFVFS